MTIFQALILSLVEGFTEFLPISSTGHLVLVSNLLNIFQSEFVKSFEIFIQLGAIMAVVVLYWKDLINTKLWPNLIAGFLPTAVLGLVFYKFIKEVLLGNVNITLAALFIGGIILVFFEKGLRLKEGKITLKKAFGIGLFQAISMVPGISRAAATVIGAMLLGVEKEEAVKFSFLLAIPTMAAASGLDLLKTSFSFTYQEFILLGIGFIGAFITAIIAIKFFIKFIQKNSLQAFGLYRILLAVVYYFVVK